MQIENMNVVYMYMYLWFFKSFFACINFSDAAYGG